MADRQSNQSTPHRIRLVGPWEFWWFDDELSLSSRPLRVHPSDLWQFECVKGRSKIVLARPFNCPSGLSSRDVVSWEAELSVAPQQVFLNSQQLTLNTLVSKAQRIHLRTESLNRFLVQGQNRLELRVDLPSDFNEILLLRSELLIESPKT